MDLFNFENFIKYSKFVESQIITQKVYESTNLADADDLTKKKAARIKVEYAGQLLSNKFPFFAEILFQQQIIYTYDPRIPTAATDGHRIFINPNFFFPMTQRQVLFVLAHEVMHTALLHTARQYTREHNRWNIAADHEINLLLQGEQIIPRDEIINVLHGYADEIYKGKSAEEIYNDPNLKIGEPPKDLPPGPPPEPPGGGSGGKINIVPGMKVRIKATGKKGIVTKVNPDGTYEIDELAAEYQDAIRESSTIGNPKTYSRPDFIPILPDTPGSGQGRESDGEVEIEGDGKKPKEDEDGEGGGKGKGKGEGEGGTGGEAGSGEDMSTKGHSEHPITEIRGPKTGEVITKEEGDSIAKGEGIDVDSNSDLPPETESAKKEKIRQAAQRHLSPRSKSAGSGNNGDIYQKIMSLTEPKVNWRQALSRFIGKLASKSEFKMPNRRFVAAGEYRHGLVDDTMMLKDAAVAMDVSGSIMSNFPELASEVVGIVKAKKIKNVYIVPFADDVVTPFDIKGTRKPTPADFAKVRTGGGTEAINKVIHYINQKTHGKPDFVVIMTDGYLTRGVPTERPAWAKKTIWLIFDNPSFEVGPEWGTVIHANQDKGYYGK